MSGAKKKLAQKEAMAQLGLTEKEKKARAEAAAKKRNKILGIVGTVIVVALVVALLVWNSGFVARHTTALEVNGHKYTVADVNFYYYQLARNAYYQELSTAQWYQSLAEQGYDMGTYTPAFDLDHDLKTQYVDADQTQSYHDLFLEQAKTQLVQITAQVDAANAAGYTPSAETQENIDSLRSQLDEVVRNNSNYSGRSAYLRLFYGRTVNESVYYKNMKLALLADDYAETAKATLTDYTDEELMAYYNENTALYNSYDYDYVYFNGQPVTGTDEEGKAIAATDEQKAQAMADAKTQAQNLLRDAKAAQTAVLGEGETRQTFTQIAAAYTTDNVPRTRRVGTTFQSAVYGEWLMDSARKDGDTEMFESEGNGYYVIQFHDSYFDNDPTVDVRHILIAAETSEDAERNEYGYPIPTQAQMQAAHDQAEELMKQFNLGEKTAEAFGELAEEHSDDGRDDNGNLKQAGGLYESVYTGEMVPNFNDWCFDPSRQVGDVGLVENAGPGYYGWHVIYFQASHEPEWLGGTNGARATKTTADKAAWDEQVLEGYEAVETSAFSRVGM